MSDHVSLNPLPAQTASSPTQQPVRAVQGEAPVETTNVNAPEKVEQTPVTAELLQDTADKLNELMSNSQRSLSFSVDSSADQVVVKVVDKDTLELVRQIPTEEALQLKEHLDAVVGMLFSDKA